MLYPQTNKYRQYFTLNGIWNFRFDFNNEGLAADWGRGLKNDRIIAVPASWNDQFVEPSNISFLFNRGVLRA